MKLLIIMILPMILFGQDFRITEDLGESPIKDPFTSNIYYYINYKNSVNQINKTLNTTTPTSFLSLPYFSETKHIAAFQYIDNSPSLYLYDFFSDDTTLLTTLNADSLKSYTRRLSFSHAGDKILINDIGPGYFNLVDSSIHYTKLTASTFENPIIWSKHDSSFYYPESYRGQYILEYNIFDAQIDTLIKYDEYSSIISFDYNARLNCFAISSIDSGHANIRIHDLNNDFSTIIYSGGFIQDLSFSPDGQSLVFFDFEYLDSCTGPLVLYSMVEDSLVILDKICTPKDFIWFNSDTIIYSDQYGISGFAIANALSIESLDSDIPTSLKSYQNYPNPFNSQTIIKYEIFERSAVEINLYDCIGQQVLNIFKGEKEAGTHLVEFHADKISSGVYFYKIKTDNITQIKKCVILK